jgi:small-conductance mechanosensitive channel
VVVRAARNLAIVALVALGFTALPGGAPTLNVILALLTICFFAAIAFLGFRLYREHRFTIDSLEPVQRAVLYSSIGLAILTFAASSRLLKGAGILVWLALLGIAAYGVFWVFQRYRSYD